VRVYVLDVIKISIFTSTQDNCFECMALASAHPSIMTISDAQVEMGACATSELLLGIIDAPVVHC